MQRNVQIFYNLKGINFTDDFEATVIPVNNRTQKDENDDNMINDMSDSNDGYTKRLYQNVSLKK